jgi:hypothetical protein
MFSPSVLCIYSFNLINAVPAVYILSEGMSCVLCAENCINILVSWKSFVIFRASLSLCLKVAHFVFC